MAKIIAIANQKGGVGKTTTTVNLGAALSEFGHKVLLIDLDPQSSLTISLRVDPSKIKYSIYDGLKGNVNWNEIVIRAEFENLDVLPSTIDLANAEVELQALIDREFVLKTMLEGAEALYDYIIIDCPPSLSVLTINALTASHHVIIPMQTDFLAAKAAGHLFNTLAKIRLRINQSITSTVLLTMTDQRTNHSREIEIGVREELKRSVHTTKIPISVRVKEAPIAGQAILSYDPKSPVSLAYRELAKEIIQ